MAHHKSAKKRIRRNERAKDQNKRYLSTVRTAVKKFRLAAGEVAAGKKKFDEITPLFRDAQAILAKAAQKGMIHRNNAARKIGRLSSLLHRVKGAPQ